MVRLPGNNYSSTFTTEDGLRVLLRMFLYTHRCINDTISFSLEELFRETGIKDQKRNKDKIVTELMRFHEEGFIILPDNFKTARLTTHISARLNREGLFYEDCDGTFTMFSFEEYEKMAKTSNVVTAVTILMAIKLRYFVVHGEYDVPIPICSIGVSDIYNITCISKPTLTKCLEEMIEQKIIYRIPKLYGERYNGEIIKLSSIYSSAFIGAMNMDFMLKDLAEKWNLKSIYKDYPNGK